MQMLLTEEHKGCSHVVALSLKGCIGTQQQSETDVEMENSRIDAEENVRKQLKPVPGELCLQVHGVQAVEQMEFPLFHGDIFKHFSGLSQSEKGRAASL